MRLLAFIDLHDPQDRDYIDFLTEEMPRRLKLLEADYGGIPWQVTFAAEEYGDDSLDAFTTTVRQNRDNYDAIILVPQSARVEEDARLQQGQPAHPYFRKLGELAAQCDGVPVIAYVDEPGPRVEYNLLSLGFSQVVDQANEPALLPLKIARAINAASGAGAESVLKVGPAQIDLRSGETRVNGAPVHLTSHERATLLYLARSRGKVRSKEHLLKNIYGLQDDEPDIKIIDVFMTKVRTKLNAVAPGLGYDLLRTAWGDGYMMLRDMPENRLHRGLLRLDPLEEGGYAIPDTQHKITDAQFDVFEHLHGALGRGVPQQDNFLLSHGEALEALERMFATYFVASGDAVERDQETGRIGLNPVYFDTTINDAGDFGSLLRQETRAVGPYIFLRVNNSHTYALKNTDIVFQSAEVRLLEQLMQVEGQAVRAHSLYKQIRGDAGARYDRTPDEDMIELAKTLYVKLQKAGIDDADRNIHIYHNAYLSFGPAEEVPDPDAIQAERREHRAGLQAEMLSKADGGRKVALERYDCGHFVLLVHPVLGRGVIEGKGVELRPQHVSLLRFIHQAREDGRPGIIAHRDLFEKVWPTRTYAQQKMGVEIYQLRNLLAGIDKAWAGALTAIPGQGFASVMPGEDIPGAAPEPMEKNIDWQDRDLGYFTLKVNPDEGSGYIEGRKQRLSPVQVNILTALHGWGDARGDAPDFMPEMTLYKHAYGDDAHYAPHRLGTAVNGLRQVLDYHAQAWAQALISRRGQGYLWLAEGQTLPQAPVAAAEPAVEYQDADIGHFTLLVNPLDGSSRIKGRNQTLGQVHTSILLALHAARDRQGETPAPVPETDLFRAVYEDREFTPGTLGTAVNQLRQILKFHDESWADRLVTKRMRGFAWLREGDVFEDDIPAPVAVKAVRVETPPTEIELVGGLVLLRDETTGRAQVRDTELVLNPSESKLLEILSARYPDNVYTSDLSRELKIKNIRQLADNFKKHWDMYCPDVMLPFTINAAGTALSWDISPTASASASAGAGADFAIGQLSGIYARCANTGIDFAPREVEMINFLQNRVGQTVSLTALGTVSKVKWDAKIALATLESALGKIRKANPALAARFEISARLGNMRLKPALRRLPAPPADNPPRCAVG